MPGPVYNSIVEIPGDGVTTQHEFSFAGGYISRTHVKARIIAADGGITEITVTDGMFVGDFTLNLGVAAPVGAITRIYRETPHAVPLADFAGGSRVTEANLDLATQQAIFAVAEAFDVGEYANVNDLLAQAGLSASSAVSASASAAGFAATATANAAAALASANAAAAAAATLVGSVAMFARTTAPTGWLKANGAAVSRTTYAALFAVVGTSFGAGDGSTTFTLPDLRGEFARGLDDGRGVDSGRALGTAQAHSTEGLYARVNVEGAATPITERITVPSWTSNIAGTGGAAVLSAAQTNGSSVAPLGTGVTRPRNVALLACIKF